MAPQTQQETTHTIITTTTNTITQQQQQTITNEGKYIDKEDRLFYRKLTPLECERLQCLPDNYTDNVSNSQRYKMIGNGWTVDVIAHILKGIR